MREAEREKESHRLLTSKHKDRARGKARDSLGSKTVNPFLELLPTQPLTGIEEVKIKIQTNRQPQRQENKKKKQRK